MYRYVVFAMVPIALFSVQAAAAQHAPVVISEIGAYETSNLEWVEVVNRSQEPVDIGSWKFFENDTNHTLKPVQGSAVLQPGAYALIVQNDAAFREANPHVAVPIFDSAWGSLKEEGEVVALRDAAGDIVESFSYVGAGESSLQRIDLDADVYTDANWQPHAVSSTVGTVNSFSVLAPENKDVAEQEQDNAATPDPEEPPTSGGKATPKRHGKPMASLGPTIGTRHVVTGTLLIHEFVSDPQKGEEEFVELYNAGKISINLLSWWLEDGSGTKTPLGVGEDYWIKPKHFLVVSKPKGALNNAGDRIQVRDPNGRVVDAVTYGNWDDGSEDDNARVAPAPYSLGRRRKKDTGVDRDDFFWGKPTPGAWNSFIDMPPEPKKISLDTPPETSVASSSEVRNAKESTVEEEARADAMNIRISELFPNPEGADTSEFIELLNTGGEPVELSGYMLDDAEGGSKPFVFPTGTLLDPGEYRSFERGVTKLALNNDRDAVRFLTPDAAVLDVVLYEAPPEAATYSRFGDAWEWTAIQTPGTENERDAPGVFGNAQQKIAPTLAAGRVEQEPDVVVLDSLVELQEYTDEFVSFSGVVSVLPGVLAPQYLYVQDPSCTGPDESGTLAIGCAGVQVYLHSKKFPVLALGDLVFVTGQLTEAYEEKRIKLKQRGDILLMERRAVPVAIPMEINALGEQHAGLLVEIVGEVIEKNTSKMLIDDGTGELAVSVKTIPKTTLKKFTEEQELEIQGVLVWRRGEFLLLPRGEGDMRIAVTRRAQMETEDDLPLKDAQGLKNAGVATPNEHGTSSPLLTFTAGSASSVLLGLILKARRAVLLAWGVRGIRVAGAAVKRFFS